MEGRLGFHLNVFSSTEIFMGAKIFFHTIGGKYVIQIFNA